MKNINEATVKNNKKSQNQEMETGSGNFTPGPYVGREQSWMDFNYRVLEEAYDKSNLIMDRLKFLAITASNLDEFFSVRIAGILDQIGVGYNKKFLDGNTPTQELKVLNKITKEFMQKQYNCLNKSLLPELEKEDIHFIEFEDLDEEERNFVDDYFTNVCFPVLTPQAVDNSRPLTLITNYATHLIVQLAPFEEGKKKKKKKEEDLWAIVEMPKVLERIISLPDTGKGKRYIFLEEVLKENISALFPEYEVSNVHEFRITRNADLDLDEDEAEDLLREIEESLKQRKFGSTVRLEITNGMNKKTKNQLMNWFDVTEDEVYTSTGPLDLKIFMGFQGRDEFSELRSPKWIPKTAPEFYKKDDIFEVIRKGDRVLSHPFESFDTVVDFVKAAATDPNVLAIKQTLYRVSGDSPIIDALIEAANNDKHVTALVELKARFDEERNIEWAKKLEKAGVHVIYGLPGLKIHGKAILVVRQEDDEIRRYVHLGTGNYNDVTAKQYTDLGLFTTNESIASDISMLFNKLSGYSRYDAWHKIAVAPTTLREKFNKLIDREIENAQRGNKGLIYAKMNALIDDQIINKLYEASQAGVEVNLIVRGMCSLIPGIEGVSDNIHVHSIVGEFLEHSRIYYFYNNGDEELYMASADWMQRNLNRRIEILFPIEEKNTKKKVKHILDTVWNDTIKTRELRSDGKYHRIDKRGKTLLNSQEKFCEEAAAAAEKAEDDYRFDLQSRKATAY